MHNCASFSTWMYKLNAKGNQSANTELIISCKILLWMFNQHCPYRRLKIYLTIIVLFCIVVSLQIMCNIQAPLNLHGSYIPKDPEQIKFCTNAYQVNIWSNIYIFIGGFSWNPNFNTLEHIHCSIITPPPVISCGTILLTLLSHCSFIPTCKNLALI